MCPHQRRRIRGSVELRCERRALKLDLYALRIRVGKIEKARPIPLHEDRITARREVIRRVHGGGGLDDHVDLLPTQIHVFFNTWSPRLGLWSINNTLH